MIKELIVAITLGALLGFGLTGGYFAIKKKPVTHITSNISPTPIISTTVTPTITPTIGPNNLSTENHTINIESPENNYLSPTSRITIKGSTSPSSKIFATTNINIFRAQADNVGNFEIEIDLESGANLVKIESISQNDEQSKIELMITYSTAKI